MTKTKREVLEEIRLRKVRSYKNLSPAIIVDTDGAILVDEKGRILTEW